MLTAAHPAKLSLVFNTQLQHELKNIARNRELTHIVPPGATLDETRPVLSTDGGRSTEINGWNLEKKMLALREVRQQLEEPFFLYADWGNEPAKAEPRRGGFSLDRTMGYYSYFNKILPLHMGQTALLDLWDYIMDMSDLVPIKNMMGPFLERIRHTDRENLLIVKFVACLLSDVRCWCSSLHDVVWHCVPGYFCLIRSVLAVCKRMCQRRGRKNDSMSPGRKPGVTAPISGEEMWQAYWTPTEQDCVFDALAEILRNPVLVTPFIQVVLEGTNILDPSNVNYSFGILQRMIDVAAGTRLITALLNGFKKSPKNANKRASRGKLPDKFVPDTFFCAMKKALESSHIQILLKVLTFLYSTIDLFPAAQRKRLVNDVLLRDNFFRFFLHWNDEIRKIYCYILVFQLTTANRLDLPCASDRILLSRSPYFESTSGNMSPSAPSFGYWSNLSEIAQSMLRIYSPSHLDAERKETIGAGGLKRLVTWDFTARMKRDRSAGGDAVFRESMEDEELSVDLSLVSKLDALFKMMADQLSPTTDVLNFPVELEVYVEKGISQYIVVLSEYYESAFQHPDVIPAAPLLDFTIMSTMFSDN
ncbi:TPA: hypothetical protein N0F65_002417 [Lagenidium giganteum]|uniref:Uncharacterized protein n=1 Tax=Lagenidium giganteum TaxID=4803 RepID=A0AAV2YNW7_9STRA|nr:TPA: hypothetical protein N0F65_002417 [Lagenidium giganteum]